MKEPYNNLDSPFTNLIDILFSLTITPLVILSSLVIGLRDKILILPFVFGIFCLLIMWVTVLPLPCATGAAHVLTFLSLESKNLSRPPNQSDRLWRRKIVSLKSVRPRYAATWGILKRRGFWPSCIRPAAGCRRIWLIVITSTIFWLTFSIS